MADVDISLDIDIKAFNKSVKSAQKSLESLGNSAKLAGESTEKGFKKGNGALDVFIGTLTSTVLVNGIKTISTTVKNMGVNFVEAASDIEDINARFKTLTGSAQNANALLKQLQEFSAGTPFQLSGLSEVTQGLLAFGFEQDQILDKLQTLGDVAAASGAGLKDLGLIFGQVSAAGKLTGERLLQLQERGIPIGKALADSMGVAETAIRDLVSRGEVDFDTFEKAFNSLAEEGGFAFEGMATQSLTLSGQISTLKDNFFLLQAEVGQQLLPIVKEVVSEVTEYIRVNKDLIAVNVAGFITSIVDGFKFIVQLYPVVASGVSIIVDAFDNLIDSAKLVGLSVPKLLGEGFNKALDGMQFLIDGVTGLIDKLNSIPGVEIEIEGFDVSRFKADLSDIDNALAEVAQDTGKSGRDFSDSINQFTESIDKFNNAEVDDKEVKVNLDTKDVTKQVSEAVSAASGSPIVKTPVSLPGSTSGGSPSTNDPRSPSGLRSCGPCSDNDSKPRSDKSSDSEDPKSDNGSKNGGSGDSGFFGGDFIPSLDEIKSGLAAFGKTAGGIVVDSISAANPKEGATKLVTSTLAAVSDAVVPGLGVFVGPLAELLAKGPEETKAFITGLVEAVPVIIEAIIDSLPVLTTELVKASPAIARALTIAIVKEVPIALVESIKDLLADVLAPEFSKIGDEARRGGKNFRESLQRSSIAWREGVVQSTQFIGQSFEGFGQSLEGLASTFGSAIEGVFVGIGNSFEDLFSKFGVNIENLFKFENAQANINEIFALEGVKEKVNGLFSLDGVASGITLKITKAFEGIDTKIIQSFIKAFDAAKTSLISVFKSLGDVFDFKVDLSDIGGDIGEGLRNAFNSILDPVRDIFNSFIDLVNGLKTPAITYDFSVLGRNFSGTILSAQDLVPGDIPRFQTGGFVQGSGVRDTVPALLSPGELVIDRTTGPRLNKFIDEAQNGGGNLEVIALLSQLVEMSAKPQAANVQLSIDGNVLADQILELNRNNARLK